MKDMFVLMSIVKEKLNGDSLKMEILFDDREGKSVEVMMKLVDEKMLMCRTRLSEGDYVVGDVCIERKTIDDFCESIIDKRLENQVIRMKEKHRRVIVIIVGNIKDRTIDIHENCILGIISKLLAEYDVSVVCVNDEFQFLYLIKRIFERFEELNSKINIVEEMK